MAGLNPVLWSFQDLEAFAKAVDICFINESRGRQRSFTLNLIQYAACWFKLQPVDGTIGNATATSPTATYTVTVTDANGETATATSRWQ